MTAKLGTYGLGASSSLLLKQLAGAGKSMFTHKDISKFWEGSKQGLNNFLSRMAKRRWIMRLERGKYMIVPFEAGPSGQFTEHEFVIASKLVAPYMIGLWSALSHHGLTEQVPDRVYLLSPKSKHRYQGLMAGVSYRILTLKRDEFFGAAFAWIGQEKIWVTDLERTLLDAVLWPHLCGGFTEVAKAFQAAKAKTDVTKLGSYAFKMGRGVAFKRLGILGEWVGWPVEALRVWRRSKSKGISLLDPLGTKSGSQISRWNLRLNFNLEGFRDQQL